MYYAGVFVNVQMLDHWNFFFPQIVSRETQRRPSCVKSLAERHKDNQAVLLQKAASYVFLGTLRLWKVLSAFNSSEVFLNIVKQLRWCRR